MKTMINVKTDSELKEKAQKVAGDLGLPLGTIINHYLRELVCERKVVFADHPIPNQKTKKILDGAFMDINNKKNIAGPFKTASAAADYLKSL